MVPILSQKDGIRLMQAFEDYKADSEGFHNLTQQKFQQGSMIMKMHPDSCGKIHDNAERRRVAVVSNNSSLADAVGKDLEHFCKCS